MKGCMRWLIVICTAALAGLVLAGKAGAIEIAPTPSQPSLAASPLVVTEFMTTSDGLPAFIQIYNNGDKAWRLSDWEIVVTRSNEAGKYKYNFPPEGYLQPGRRLVLADNEAIQGEGIVPFTDDIEELSQGDNVRLVAKNGLFNDEIFPMADKPFGVRYGLRLSAQGNVTASRVYDKLKEQDASLLADAIYLPRENFPLVPIEILSHGRDCSPLEEAIECGDYVKFYNDTNGPVDFEGVRLRFGLKGQAVNKQNAVPLSGVIDPGKYSVFNMNTDGQGLALPNGGSFVWLEDAEGVVIYENTMTSYPDNGSRKGVSWARGVDGVWSWATPSPTGENKLIVVDSKQKSNHEPTPCPAGQERNPTTNRCRKIAVAKNQEPCPTGQERNPETGRCRKINAAKNEPKPCAADEYRHPTTNRCRKLTTLASTKKLTPCKPGEERNPLTNRCRKIASAKQLKPCPAGQERNPITNRCRKAQVTKMTDSQKFAPEEVAASKDTVTAWWVMGGLGVSAAGYAGWEWRREVGAWAGKLKNLITGGR